MSTGGAGRAAVRSVGGIVAALLLVLVPVSVLASGWAIVASPNAVGSLDTDQLYSTTCASSTECWAVGQFLAGTAIEQTLIQASGTGAWTTVESPNVNDGGTQSNSLYGVTCASPTECWAVGEHGTSPDQQTLVEEWNGGSWVVVDSPSTSATQNNLLFGVACATSTLCWAAGSYQSSSGVYQTLIEQWDGTSWAIVASPDTASTEYNELMGVTCASATECWAVGSAPQQPLIEEWTGSAWTMVTSPTTPGSVNNSLDSVTCISPINCWAVGVYGGVANGLNTLAEQWNGVLWSVVSTPNPSTTYSNILRSVSCTSANQCWAFGWDNDSTFPPALVEEWTGAAWTVVSVTGAAGAGEMTGVTCWSSTECWAVGTAYESGSPDAQTLIDAWGGSTWTATTSPNSTGTTTADNQLSDITCASASECWAAGDGLAIEGWNGNSWQLATSPPAPSGRLSGVSCATPATCWAVGSSYVDGAGQTLIDEWNAGAWTIVTSPDTSASQDNALEGVTCASATVCWAVGTVSSGGVSQTLIEEWQSGAWTIVTSPDTDPSQNNELSSVTCASASVCWAVGDSETSVTQTLIEEWDGVSWTIVPSPDSSPDNNQLNRVTCASADECWAVGQYYTPGNGGDAQTLIEEWTGASWTVVPSPNEVDAFGRIESNALNGVACLSPSNCWAVGGYYAESTGAGLDSH